MIAQTYFIKMLTDKEINYFAEQLPKYVSIVRHKDVNSCQDFVERYYPNYSRCDLIAEREDLTNIVNREIYEGDDSSVMMSELMNTAYLNNPSFNEQELQDVVHNMANDRLNAVESEVYRKSIEGFIKEIKGG